MENIVYNEIDNDDDGEMNYMKFVVKDRDTQKQLENYLQEISNKYFDQVDEEDLDYVFNVSVFQDIEEFITTFSVPFDDEINYEIIESIEEKFGDSVKNVPYYYAKGGFLGGIFGGKRTYKKGLAYKLDRAKHNKSEDWEVPMKNRKKDNYANGGGEFKKYGSGGGVKDWMNEKTRAVIIRIQKNKPKGFHKINGRDYIYTTYIADVAEDMGIRLTGKEMRLISEGFNESKFDDGGGVNKNWDSFYNGGGIDETVIVYAENKDGHRKIISEHKSVNSAKNKIKKISNEVFNDSNIESIGTMGKIEFEKHYKDFTFSNGGGVDEIRMFHNGVFYKLGYSEEDNFYIKDFQEDSLKGFKEVGFDTEREARDYAEELIDSKYANDKTYGELYNKIVLAVMKDIKVSREKAEDIVNKNEGWLTDMIEYEGETNVTFLADQITTTDEGLYANGGGVNFGDGMTSESDGSPYNPIIIKAIQEWNDVTDKENEIGYNSKERKIIINHFKNKYNYTVDDVLYWIQNDLDNEYANGGGVEDYDYYGSMTDESVVMQNCSNGEIHCDILEEIIGSKPEYPYQQVGSIRLQKCYLRPYYKIS